MSPAIIVKIAMIGAGTCCVVAGLAYIADGRPWTAFTMLLYAVAYGTIYMSGAH